MRSRIVAMSSSALAAVALSLAGVAPASAYSVLRRVPDATSACDAICFDLASKALGTGDIQTYAAPGVFLASGSNLLPTQDFTGISAGTMGNLCGTPGGIPASAYVCKHPKHFPPSLDAWEWDYDPYGNDTGLCEGAAKAIPGKPVILQVCGALLAGKDLWVPDTLRGTGPGTCLTGRYCPWYNAGGKALLPVVLKVKNPGVQLILANAGTSKTAGNRKQFCMAPGPFVSAAC